MCDQGSEAKSKLGAKVTYGHCIDVICKSSDVQLQWPSFDDLYHQVSSGIFLNNGTKKYILDKNTNSNWYFLYARAFSIAWIQDPRYWRWINITESGQTYEVAECIQVSWFDIRVKVSATFFTPRVVYDVIWKIQLTNNASGWEHPVNIELMRPNGCKIEHKQSLQSVKRGDWLEISGGDFLVDNCGCENGGEIELHMYEHGGHWKRGFLLKGVEFRPHGSDCA